jgi:hypothetical protein
MASVLVALLSASASCAAATPPPDRPVPPSEPRATLDVMLDLPRRVGCEDAFDLTLYENRGIDLIEWQGGSTNDCTARHAKIRFLPKRLSREKTVALIKGAAVKMEIVGP